jgi:glycogen synthase
MTTDVVGGVWDFCVTLARELHQRDAAVTLLALGAPSASQAAQAADAGVSLVVEPLKLEWMQDSELDVVRTREVIARLVRDLQPDVVHANQFVAACVQTDVPVVLTLHSDVLTWQRWTLGTATPPAWTPYARLVREALDRADRVVAVSAFLADAVRDAYACGRTIDVIHNGWRSEALPVSARARRTLIAGRVWDAAKNVSLAARAAQGWDAGRVLLAGEQMSPDGGLRVEVPPPLESLGYLARGELDAALGRSLIYLSPALYDPFGLLPLQAALNGCALLLSDIPSYRELWDGVATFFRSDDAADLRRQWACLLDRPDAARELAIRARQRAIERYSVSRMADAYADVYRSLSPTRTEAAA